MPRALSADPPSLAAVLAVRGGAAAVDFYRTVFGASVQLRLDREDGTLNYAELEIGGSIVMVTEEGPGGSISSPTTLGGTSVRLSISVDDVDTVYARALGAGGDSIHEVRDEFYGDRTGQFRDPFGHVWNVAAHIEDVTSEEIARRAADDAPG